MTVVKRQTASQSGVSSEVEVLKASDHMIVGFAGSNFRGEMLGADERGWGIVKSGAAKHRRVGEGEGDRVRCGPMHAGGGQFWLGAPGA